MKVIKRNGAEVEFDKERIIVAISKAKDDTASSNISETQIKEIADYIEQETAKIDRAIPVLEKEIELLKEYRTRLISDVVTGQMDVRNVEVPEYTPEEDIAEEAPEEQEVEMDAD